jgi:hypothetical protein
MAENVAGGTDGTPTNEYADEYEKRAAEQSHDDAFPSDELTEDENDRKFRHD